MENIAQEKARIERSGRLHWYHWALVLASLALTLTAWAITKHQVEEKNETRFSREADGLLELVRERMEKYENSLWSGVSAIQMAGGNVSLERWQRFAHTLSIDTKYPGINGIGVIHYIEPDNLAGYLDEQRRARPDFRIFPPHEHSEFWPITYVEPSAPNLKAIGLDMAHETNRFTAAKSARDSGESRITGPIELVQDRERTPGFLFYAPFYRSGAHRTTEERRENFLGLVYAPFVVKKLMAGTLQKENRHVGISIRDQDTSLYSEHTKAEPDYDPDALFSRTVEIDVYGRTWTFDLRSTRSFRENSSSAQPTIILSSGLLIDALLLALFIFLTRANRNATAFAQRMSQSYQLKSEELTQNVEQLEQSNRDLERFAYAASHDLKSPLRAIDNLAEWIESDLNEVMSDENKEQMTLLRNRVRRLEALLEGLLQYSRVGRQSAEIEFVDMKSVIDEIVDLLDLPASFTVDVVTALPRMHTAKAPLNQVLTNLIGNAVKHHDRDAGRVEISAKDLGDFVEVAVADDGPGIEEAYHDRIFQLYQTLKPRDKVEGSGLGLTMVSKQVEAHGGTIAVESTDGQRGTTFRFTWPKQELPESQADAA